MSYRGLGLLPAISPTTMFAQNVDPYAFSQVPPGSVYAPYGWGPDFMYGMPMNYSHHIGYERTPIPGARRTGSMYDVVNPYLGESDSGDGLGGCTPVPGAIGAYVATRDDVVTRYAVVGHDGRRGVGQYEADYRQLGAVARRLPRRRGIGQSFMAGLSGVLAVL